MFFKIVSVSYLDDKLTINYVANIYNVAYKEIMYFNRNYNGFLDSIKPNRNHRTFKSSYIYIYI